MPPESDMPWQWIAIGCCALTSLAILVIAGNSTRLAKGLRSQLAETNARLAAIEKYLHIERIRET